MVTLHVVTLCTNRYSLSAHTFPAAAQGTGASHMGQGMGHGMGHARLALSCEPDARSFVEYRILAWDSPHGVAAACKADGIVGLHTLWNGDSAP